jgi:hypothetical protein
LDLDGRQLVRALRHMAIEQAAIDPFGRRRLRTDRPRGLCVSLLG